jgi:uncharacterized glyoxalase superfamily protein PhnB
MSITSSGKREPSIWASLVSDDAPSLRDWLLALGFTEDLLIPGERETPCRPGTASLHVVTADPDGVYARARGLSAPVVHELTDQTDHPSRDFTIADPDGNHWTFATFAG